MKAIMTFIFFFCCCKATFGLLCPECSQYMLDEDKFCPNCGWEKRKLPLETPRHYTPPAKPQSPAPPYHEYVKSQNSGKGVGEHLAGTGRGFATVAFSPLNAVRGMVTGFCWTGAIVEGGNISDGKAIGYLAMVVVPVGTALSSFAICADVINGTLDMVTVGCYGDWLYDSELSDKPTPWVWERKWNTCEIPWINRK